MSMTFLSRRLGLIFLALALGASGAYSVSRASGQPSGRSLVSQGEEASEAVAHLPGTRAGVPGVVPTEWSSAIQRPAQDIAFSADPARGEDGGGQRQPRGARLASAEEPELGNLPERITFTYSVGDAQFVPESHRLVPQNVAGEDPLTWHAAGSAAWFVITPTTGTTPDSFDVVPSAFLTRPGTRVSSPITVTVTAPPQVEGSPRTITASLRVTDEPIRRVYLPNLLTGYVPPPGELVPDDIHINQWALEKVNASLAWGLSTGEGILIAIIDSGVDTDHPDLASKLWVNESEIPGNGIDDDGNGYVDDCNGYGFLQPIGPTETIEDDYGHGTHVAGIAAAATDNATGVAGLGWGSRIQTLKVLGNDGSGFLEDVVSAIYYATDNGARVINLSLGANSVCPSLLQAAVDYASANRVIVMAAAGNNPPLQPQDVFPANCAQVMGTAGTDWSDIRAPNSIPGDHVSVAAPGGYHFPLTGGIYSTAWPGDSDFRCTGKHYCYKSGTSMATAYAAGLAALVIARYPSYTPDEIASAILDNAVDLGTPGWDEEYGCGRIDAYAALAHGATGPYPACLAGRIWSEPDRIGDSNDPTVSEAPFAPGEVIVGLQPGTATAAFAARYDVRPEHLGRLDAWRLQVPVGEERPILARLRSDPLVRHASLNYLVFAQ